MPKLLLAFEITIAIMIFGPDIHNRVFPYVDLGYRHCHQLKKLSKPKFIIFLSALNRFKKNFEGP